MIRLLLADDEDLLRGALGALLGLEDDIEVVAEASTSTGAVRLALEHRPDIAVLDLEMPPTDGLRAAEEIRAALPTRIVLVTRHARPAVLRRALAAGVSGFVPKTTEATRLAEIIRDVAAGRRYVDPEIAASALTEDACPLSERELEVLECPSGLLSVVSRVAPPDIGRACGTFSTMRQLGGAFGIAILGAAFAATGGYASPRAFTGGAVTGRRADAQASPVTR